MRLNNGCQKCLACLTSVYWVLRQHRLSINTCTTIRRWQLKVQLHSSPAFKWQTDNDDEWRYTAPMVQSAWCKHVVLTKWQPETYKKDAVNQKPNQIFYTTFELILIIEVFKFPVDNLNVILWIRFIHNRKHQSMLTSHNSLQSLKGVQVEMCA